MLGFCSIVRIELSFDTGLDAGGGSTTVNVGAKSMKWALTMFSFTHPCHGIAHKHRLVEMGATTSRPPATFLVPQYEVIGSITDKFSVIKA